MGNIQLDYRKILSLKKTKQIITVLGTILSDDLVTREASLIMD